eukprot:6462688-Karenia_brevis.AAC.1
MHDLSTALERWIESVRLYERRKDSNGDRCRIADDVKIAALEDLVPPELEKHMRLNADRFTTYDETIEDISRFIEARTGHGVLQCRSERRDPNAMDVGGL